MNSFYYLQTVEVFFRFGCLIQKMLGRDSKYLYNLIHLINFICAREEGLSRMHLNLKSQITLYKQLYIYEQLMRRKFFLSFYGTEKFRKSCNQNVVKLQRKCW